MTAERPTESIEFAESGPPADPGSQLPQDPGSGIRGAGYGFKQPIPHEEFNWIHRTIGRWIKWIDQRLNGFASLAEFIEATEPGDVAVVAPSPVTRGAQTVFVESAPEIFDIECDGLHLFILAGGSGNLDVIRHNLLTNTSDKLATFTSVNLAAGVRLNTNGREVVVAYRTTGDAGTIQAMDIDGDSLWTQAYPASPLRSLAGTAISHDSYYISWTITGDTDITERRTLSSGTSAGFVLQNGLSVRATNGEYVACALSDDSIRLYTANLNNLLWSATLGGAGAVPRIAMNNRVIFFSGSDDNLRIVLLNPDVAFEITSMSFDLAALYLDPDDLVSTGVGASVATVTSVGEDFSETSLTFWHQFAEDLDLTNPVIDICADGENVYLAGEVSGGDYGVWGLSKGGGPRVWQRVDPADQGIWSRQLAIPQ